MNAYDLLALFYDPTISWLYRKHREKASRALELQPGSRVLVPGCGTGQDFEFLAPSVGNEGAVVGVDLSAGMLSRARRRVERRGWPKVELHAGDVRTLGAMDIGRVDCALFFLMLSVVPDWQNVFREVWERIEAGGRCVVFDVHARRRVPQSGLVERLARADLSRRVWEPLLELAPDAEHRVLAGSAHLHGGELHLCTGTKPGGRV